MKNLLLFLFLTFTLMCNAKEVCDTVAFSNANIERIVEENYTNSKGVESVKYYILTKQKQLIPIGRVVAIKIELCKKYGAECDLVAIVSRKTGKIKRIILD